MKKLILALTLGLSSMAFGQADLAVTLNSPMANATFGPNVPFTLDFTVSNPGTVDIDLQDSVIFQMSLDGTPLSVNGGSLFYFDSVNIAAGGGTHNITFPPLTLSIPGQPMTSMNFCITAYAVGAGWTGVTEANTANNQACNTVTYDPNSVGLAENAQRAELSLTMKDESYYANGTYFVRMNNEVIKGQPALVVYNITGAEVLRTELTSNGSDIDQDVNIESLNKGIYLVEVQGLADRSVKKIVVQ